jgi:hypothetical protein
MRESWAIRIPMLNCPHCEQSLTPHEIGVLYTAVGRTQNRTARHFWGAKLTGQDADRIRNSKDATSKLAEKYKVSFATIWRIQNNVTHKIPSELNCPHCGHKLTPKEIGSLFATLGGSISGLRRAKTAVLIINGREVAKLTEKDVANIRKSKDSTKELATQYGVRRWIITLIKRDETWKSIPQNKQVQQSY